MTHPSVDEVAEHLEGVLSAEAAARMRAHLASCARCTATAERLAAVPGALRAAAETSTSMPDHVSARVEAALAEEARRRSSGSPVSTLDERRRSRRRRVGGAVLAAAAAVVVGIGISQVAGGPAQPELSESSRGAAEQAPRTLRSESAASAPADDQAPDAWGALVARVAAGHDPGSAPRERAGCVASALNDPRWPGVSYAVTVPPPPRDRAGAVVLRPRAAPREGLLVACTPEPVVLLSRSLGQ